MTFLTQIITSGADDGSGVSGTFNASTLANGFNPTVYYGGLRFQGVAVPQGALITSATLVLQSAGTAFGGSGTNWGYWYGDAADNSAAWTNSDRPDQRTKTTANSAVIWSTVNTTPVPTDVTAIIQEIVNRAGWASGNALSIVGDGSSSGDGLALFREIDGLSYKTPMIISYVSPPGGGSTGRGGMMAGASLIDTAPRTMLLTNLLIPRSREDTGQRCWANWLLDRLIYRGVKGKAKAYLGTKIEAQMYLGERDLF